MTGEEVKKLRESLDMSQADFGARCGVKLRTVQYWESKGASGRNETLLKSLLGGAANFAAVSSGSASGAGSASVAGNGNNVNAGEALLRAFDEIAAQRKVTEKAQAQIDELLAIVRNLSGGDQKK